MTTGVGADAPAPWADRSGRALMAFDALATLGAFADGLTRMADTPDEYLLTQAWRTFAYIVFAGLWAMIAIAPRAQRGVWELLLIHKIGITAFALAVIEVPEATKHVVVDGFLVVTTVLAYVLCRGWTTWRTAGTREVALRDGFQR